jgi:hypothetical protein
MPTITSAAPRGTIDTGSAQAQPMKTIIANTKASFIQSPFEAAQKAEATDTTEESGQELTPVAEESKSQEAVTLSPQLTALARREQKFRQQEQAFKAERAKFEAEKLEVAGLKPLKEKLAAKDYSALEELGIDYNEYTEYLLNKPEADKPENKALSELREELNSFKENQKKNEEKQYEATVSQYRNDIKALVAKDPQFESIKESGAEEHVLQHILSTFEEDGEVLSVEEAAREVEEQIIEDALKLAKLSKVQAKMAPEKKTLPPPTKQSTGLRTLTQQIAPPTGKTYAQFQHLSPRERLAQAIAKANRPKE